MTSTAQRISASLFLGVLIVLILSNGFYSTSRFLPSSLLTEIHKVSDHEPAAALVDSKAAVLLQKIGTPFGSREALRLSRSLDKARITRAKRQDFDPTWINAYGQGVKLFALLNGGKRSDSPFQRLTDLTGPNDLTTAEIVHGEGKGWEVSEGPNETPDLYDEVFEDLDIPNGAINQGREIVNEVPFENCRHRDNEPTGASFMVSLNVLGRSITALSSFSPAYMLKQNYAGMHQPLPQDWQEHLPDVSRQLEVLWILWKDVADDEASQLKYIFRHHIITQETKSIIEHVTGADVGALNLPWPGRVFEPPSNLFIGLLGTPHGRGVAYLLTQHASGLPGKNIKSITVFTTEEDAYHLLFTLTD